MNKQLFLIILWVCPIYLLGSTPNWGSEQSFCADIQEGIIGVNEHSPLDDPQDNIFHIELNQTPSATQTAWLVYELKGVQDHTAVARSINTRQAVGGYLVQPSDNWTIQKEQIDPKWLKKGLNTIQFTIPKTTEYHYKVRELKLVFESNPKPERALIISSNTGTYQNNKAYFKGFMTGDLAENANLFVNGTSFPTQGGAFEILLDKPSPATNPWFVEIMAVYPDGTILKKELELNPQQQTSIYHDFLPKSIPYYQQVSALQTTEISLSGTKLTLPAGALLEDELFSITPLRDIDLPTLAPDLINITNACAGYRYLPHGAHFQQEARLSISYAPEAIPSGYTPQDIRIFYFDDLDKRWIIVPTDTLLIDQNEIVARTNHFTDFIAGIIKIPESPQTFANTPNSIQDFALGDPSAQIRPIAPPIANAFGSANVDFPLKLPLGRQGMMPELSISYNSDNESSWLGMGWDLTISNFTIDTRWGVPRYDPEKETETYLFEGEQLVPFAHRDDFQDRTSEKQFFPRIETSFNTIIRHGDSPKNYWWEVTSKTGMKSYYGGIDGDVVESAVLKDGSGNIAQWNLVEKRDLNDNFIRYHYTVVTESGANGIQGKEIYLDHISYTGHGDQEGLYQVRFKRDNGERRDVRLDARLGFPRVSASRLQEIEVLFSDELVRSYTLNYMEGAFYKSLLSSIVEKDKTGADFYEHSFTYYDDVRNNGTYRPYQPQETWTVPSDDVTGGFLNPISQFSDNTSVLGGASSTNFSIGGAVTVGILGNLLSKRNTAGPTYSNSTSTAKGLVALIDINGDGLPDKVFRDDDANQLFYRPNLAVHPDSATRFGSKFLIDRVRLFQNTKTTSNSIGVEAHPLIAFVGGETTFSKTTVDTYFTDANGDGLIDVVSKGQVNFSYVDDSGNPQFSQNSGDTPSPIIAGEDIDGGLIEVDPDEQERLIDEYPLHDVVRMWQAPSTGSIRIDGAVQLLLGEEALADPKKDGVRVAIQLNGSELWSEEIAGTDSSPKTPTNTQGIFVNRGDRIYFRVQSIFNGAHDRVQWDPEITYLSIPTEFLDPNNKQVGRFKASEDFTLASCQSLLLPLDGNININGIFQKPVSSDEQTVQVLRLSGINFETVYQQTYAPDTAIIDTIELTDIAVEEKDQFFFRVKTNTNVDWSAVNWRPQLYYTSASDSLGNPVQVISTNGDTLVQIYPSVEFSMFNDVRQNTPIWEAPGNNTFRFTPILNLDNGVDSLFGDVTFSVKGLQKLYGKATFYVDDGALPQLPTITVELNQSDSIYFEYHVGNRNIAIAMETADVEIDQNGNINQADAGIFTKIRMEDEIFGSLYRGWGQFVYNGNRDRALEPIQEDQLKIEEIEPVDVEEIDDPENIDVGYDPKSASFVFMVANPESGTWIGVDDQTRLGPDWISSSRYGEDDIDLSGTVGTGAQAPSLQMKSTIISVAAGAGAGPLNGSASGSINTSENIIDLIDFNGDRYPDVVSSTAIQYTLPTGGLSSQTRSHQGGSHKAKSDAVGFTLGGDFVYSSASNAGDTPGAGSKRKSRRSKSTSNRAGKNAKGATKSAQASIGISGNLTTDTDHTEISWMDINGDGLVDKVYRNGRVALNLGYKFEATKNWQFDEIRAGKSLDYGGGLGVNLNNGSIAAGLSLSRTDLFTTHSFQDVNGDGLPDYITSLNPVKVQINTGTGFQSSIPWTGIDSLDVGAATGESLNFAITACIPIPFIGIRICINPSSATGRGVNRIRNQLNDIDGDGYLDFLRSDNDGQLLVRRSSIGRTNLLKSIKRPLGATINLDFTLAQKTYGQPNSKWLLAAVEVNDGFAGDGVDKMKSRFHYKDGYYDRHERTFYGFREVKSQELDTENGDALYRTEVAIYENDSYYEKGLLADRWLEDAAGNKFLETQQTYVLRNRQNGNPIPPGVDLGTAFPALKETKELYYEGQDIPGLQRLITYTYDSIGNIIQYVDSGNGNPADLLEANIQYHNTANITSIPKSIEVLTNQGIIRKRENDIDPKGNPIQIRQFLEDGTVVPTDMEYDEFGNVTKVTRPPNAAGERWFIDYSYDPVVHIYPIENQNAYGYQSSSTYDYAFGEILSQTDINGQKTEYTIDEKGRRLTVRGPYEIEANKPYTWKYEYHPDATTPYAKTFHYDPEHESDIETINFVDGLFRSVQVKETASLFNGENQEDRLAMIVSGTTLFDAFGREVAQYYPITEPLGNNEQVNVGLDDIAPTRTDFDVLDRALSYTLPDGAQTNLMYEIGSDQNNLPRFKTTEIDPTGRKRDSYVDIRGRFVAMTDHGPNGEIWTNFQYNPIGELLKSIDHLGNETIYTYDLLGRKLSRKHPDAGLTSYQYDLADNLLRKSTANLRSSIGEDASIRYSYDFERLVEINYPKNFQNKIQFHYGQPDAPFNRVGRIWLQEDASGGREYFFGPLGEVTKEIRSIVIRESEVRTYVSEYEYDTWNRIQEIAYPDGEVVKYEYNRAGKLQKMEGVKFDRIYPYIDQLGYDEFEQRVFCAYGNETSTNYTYEPTRRRLSGLKAKNKANRTLLDNSYAYDAVDNILSIQNSAQIVPGKLGGSSKHEFGYDQLHRLTSASGSWQGEKRTEEYLLDVQYDNSHNIVEKAQTHLRDGQLVEANSYSFSYSYDKTPHTPSQIGERVYEYDANGNTTGWSVDGPDGGFRQMLWDEEDRVMGVIDNGYLSQYSYDALDNRAVKSHGGMQGAFIDGAPTGIINHKENYTAYISPFLTARGESFTKHYYVEGERIASKLGSGKFSNNFWSERRISAGGINYSLRAYLLQLEALKLAAEKGVPPGPPPLQGLYLQPEFTGEAFPDFEAEGYLAVPPGWPGPPGPPDPNGPPGPPTWHPEEPTNETVEAGYGYQGNGVFWEVDQYFYHPDHLGNTSYITDLNGEVRQHVEYFPFGETFVEEHTSSSTQPYRFNSKQLDDETGLYYYGARYYDPQTSIWQSIDPLVEDYPAHSPYSFVLNNPIVYRDPDGRNAEKGDHSTKSPTPNGLMALATPSNAPAASTASGPTALPSPPQSAPTSQGKRYTITQAAAAGWKAEDGNWIWPENNGFSGDPERVTVKKGIVLSRFGHNGGRFVSPESVSYEERALAPDTKEKPFKRFVVKKDFSVLAGKASPWFGEKGGGEQYFLDERVQTLIDQGFIKELKPKRQRRKKRSNKTVKNPNN